MTVMSTPSRKMSWRTERERVSVLAALALQKETVMNRLLALREQHELTQERAAAKVGVTMRQWQRWESGQSTPYPRNLDAIAEKFGIDVASFFEGGSPEDVKMDGGAPTSQLDRIENKLDRLLEYLGAGSSDAGPGNFLQILRDAAARSNEQ